jgi:hypothetical protein
VSRREDIDNAVWSDEDYVSLSPDAKLLYLWSFTNPACGMAGLYKCDRGLAAYQTKLTPKRVDNAIRELSDAAFLYWEEGVIWVRSRVKYLRTKHDNILKSIAMDVSKIAEGHPLRVAFIEEYHDYGKLAPFLSGMRNSLNVARTSGDLRENVR